MDGRRDFTLQLLAKAGGERKSAPGAGLGLVRPTAEDGFTGPQVLVAAEGTPFWALPALREAASLRRFGYKVELLADETLLGQLKRHIPPQCVCRTGALQGVQEELPAAVVAAASPGLLAKLSLGLWEGPAAQTILWALWQGVPAWFDFSCTEKDPDGTPCQNKELSALYKGYAAAAQKMGLQHYSRGGLLQALRAPGGPSCPGKPPSPSGESSPAGRVFITQKDVQRYAGEAEWPLPPGAVVTAAAKDEAARRKIVFTEENMG